jgi:Zn ribbon nucleic-acid-binding protein
MFTKYIGYMVLDARCPNCNLKASVDDDMKNVKCKNCGFESSYDDYIDIMKDKAIGLSENFTFR